MGIPFYGKSYVLADKNVNAVGSPSKGPGAKSLFINETGILPYFEICQLIKTRMLKETNDNETKIASIKIASTWIGIVIKFFNKFYFMHLQILESYLRLR
jgi:chitinase